MLKLFNLRRIQDTEEAVGKGGFGKKEENLRQFL